MSTVVQNLLWWRHIWIRVNLRLWCCFVYVHKFGICIYWTDFKTDSDSVTYFRSIGQRHVDRLSYPLVLFWSYLARSIHIWCHQNSMCYIRWCIHICPLCSFRNTEGHLPCLRERFVGPNQANQNQKRSPNLEGGEF
jgi:hypothetical protein